MGLDDFNLLHEGNDLQETAIYCPYCGESISVLLNVEDAGLDYIEDCQVCCQPINFLVSESVNGELSVRVYSDDEAF